jgi:hypothetical protein
VSTQTERALRAELLRRAATVPPTPDAYDRVMHRRKASRRRRVAATALGAAAVVTTGTLLVPTWPDLVRDDAPATTRIAADGPSTWPTRGSLAHDEAFLAEARNLFGIRHGATPEEVHVFYAGDLGERRVVAAVAKGEIWMLTAARGAERGFKGAPGEVSGNGMVALAVPAGPGSTVVVMSERGTSRVEFSARQAFSPTGDVTRTWVELPRRNGVFTAHLDVPVTPRMRARAITDGQVVADTRVMTGTEFLSTPRADARLRALTEEAAGDRPLPKLADAVAQLEASALVGETINAIDVPWRLPDQHGGLWVGVVVRLVGGAAMEGMFYDDHPDEGSSRVLSAPALRYVRPVPAEAAGKTVRVWDTGCAIAGYVPNPAAVSVELVVAGEAQPRVPITGDLINETYCTSEAELDRVEGKVEVRLYDADGRRVWTGRPFSPGEAPYATLDVPSTRGRRVG